MKFFISLLFLTINLIALSISSDDQYRVFESDKYSITFTKQYEKEAIFIRENLDDFFKLNDASFEYSFDEPLRIVLISNNIQVANAFSTQIPYNMTAFYNGGTSMVDYFGTTSWLSTILTHELIHNYQLNAKKSEISKTLHKYLGNNFMPVWATIVPLWTLPNLMLPTGLLEGNSVLNESIYDNGGRLYNGRFKALLNSLAFANTITPNSFINDTLDFPYMESKYIIGGYYMKYLADLFGIDKVNSFFYNHSIHSINPFLLNETFYNTFGMSYEKTFLNFVKHIKQTNQKFKPLQNGKLLATSNSEIYLNKIDEKIIFLSHNLKERPILNSYNHKTGGFTNEESKLQNGIVFSINNTLYSSTEGYISAKLYKQGLFDNEANILPSTEGKAIQDIKNNHIASFKISESFDKPALYFDEQFIDFVSSSALFDENNNLYYFIQNGVTRSLYKNKTLLFSFDGYNSKVVDIDNETVYFIANTEFGSGLYSFKDGDFIQITDSDNIINGKKVASNSYVVVTINADGYKTILIDNPTHYPINNLPQTQPLKNPIQFTFHNPSGDENITFINYNELKELQFSMLYPYYINDSTKGNTYSLNALFLDPVMFNMLTMNYLKNYEESIAGASYINERYIPFELTYYGIQQNNPTIYERDYYAKAKIYGPLFKNNLNLIDLEFSKYKDNNYNKKEPISAAIKYTYNETYNLGSKPFLNYDLEAIVREDRDHMTKGLKGNFNHHLFGDTYFDFNGKIINNKTYNNYTHAGIELVYDSFDLEKDLTNVLIEGLDYNLFVKNLTSTGIGFSTTFYLSKYYPTFPISFRKERVFGSLNKYNIETNNHKTINENILGIEFDLLFFHKLSLPLTIKYIKNDYATNDKKVIIQIGGEF